MTPDQLRSGVHEPSSPTPAIPTAQIWQWAKEDEQSVVSLIQALVRVPSRGGIDPYDPILELIEGWLSARDLSARRVYDKTTRRTVALTCDVVGARLSPRYVLDACVDTAPFGDLDAWRHAPTSGTIEDGWLYGRGAADSKAAIALFAHIAARLQGQAEQLHGTVTLLFDADEHTGRFRGAKGYFGGSAAARDVAGVMIGYPGTDELVIGGRGFLRAELTLWGQAGHTGSQRSASNENAIDKAAELVRLLVNHSQPGPTDPELGLPPKMTVTEISGGESYSIIPDRCSVKVDARLTTLFDEAAARSLIQQTAATIDSRWPKGKSTTIAVGESWPAYKLSEDAPIRNALLAGARRYLPDPVTARVAGPSNIGNYLASLGIEATAGLGVRYEGLHGADERIDLATVRAIQATYHDALLNLLSPV